MALSAMQEHLRDERIWCVAARVALHDGESQHYEIGQNGQMIITVRSNRHDVPIRAILKGGGGSNVGVWFIPPVGTEVIICFDDGMFEGDAYIVGIHGKAPSSLQPDKVLIYGSSVEVRSENGVAKKLLTEDDATALKNAISGGAITPEDGGAAFKASLVSALSTWPTATSVLKGE